MHHKSSSNLPVLEENTGSTHLINHKNMVKKHSEFLFWNISKKFWPRSTSSKCTLYFVIKNTWAKLFALQNWHLLTWTVNETTRTFWADYIHEKSDETLASCRFSCGCLIKCCKILQRKKMYNFAVKTIQK